MAKKKRLFGEPRQPNTPPSSDFVGREEYLEAFQAALEDESTDVIFDVHGQGGVGKTTLLQRFIGLSKLNGYTTVLVDVEDKDFYDIVAFMAHLAQALTKKGAKFKKFDDKYKDYLQEKGKLDADPERPKGGIGNLVKMGLKAGANLGKELIPGGGYIPTDSLANLAGDWADFVARKIGNQDNLALVLQPIKVLTPLWVEGFNSLEENLTLLIDTYEAANPALDKWLHQLLTQHYGAIGYFLLVIGGRDPLPMQSWQSLKKWRCKISLEAFTKEEATTYLIKKNITNPEVIASILALSKCLPVYLALLAETDGTGDPNEQVVERFLKHLQDPTERNLALQAALPNQLNQDIIKCLLPEGLKDKAKAYFEWLKKRPFVIKRAGVWTYHPIVRDLMRGYQLEVSKEEWEQLHTNLAAWYRIRVEREQVEGTIEDWVQDKDWRAAQVEYHFHCLCGHYKQYLSAVIQDFASIAWFSKYVHTLPLVEVIKQVEELLNVEFPIGNMLQEGIDGLSAENREEHSTAILAMLAYINSKEFIQRDKEKAKFYFLQGLFEEDLDNSIECYLMTTNIQPDDHVAFYNLGITYHNKKEFDLAILNYKKAIQLNPDDHKAFNNLGITYNNKKEFDLAILNYKKAIQLNPDDHKAFNNLGNTYDNKKEFDLAILNYKKAIQLNPDDPEAFFNLGITYNNKKEFDLAILNYKKAIQLNPDDHQAFFNLGNAYNNKKEFDLAILNYKKAIQLNPDDHQAFFNLGNAYHNKKEFDLAILNYKKAIQLNPDDHQAFFNLGNTYDNKKEFDLAILNYKKAIQLNPDDPEAFFNLGNAYHNKKEFDLAILNYKKAIQLNPDDPEAFFNLGNTYDNKKEFDLAILNYKKAIQLNPDYPEAFFNLGNTYDNKKEFDLAILNYKKAIQLNPDYPEAFDSLGDVYCKKSEFNLAFEAYLKALEIKPNDQEVHHSLAWAHLLQSNNKEAEKHLNITWELSNQSHSYAAMNLGHCALLQNQPTQALAWYQKSLPLWEDLNEFWQDMKNDYTELTMQEKGITPVAYQALLQQLKDSL